MQEDIEKKTEERLKAKFAATLFGELVGLVAMERDAEEKIMRLTAELAAIRAQRQQVIKVIRSAGIERTGQADQEGSSETKSTAVTASASVSDEGKTHKQMIVEIVAEVGETGIRAFEIGNEIKKRYGKDIASGLHTQIARLSKEGKIRRQGEGWKLTQKNAG